MLNINGMLFVNALLLRIDEPLYIRAILHIALCGKHNGGRELFLRIKFKYLTFYFLIWKESESFAAEDFTDAFCFLSLS